ncbi:MAG: YebC/PmpR family DNA-binding transcriptional regulator [Saprospiraceae bacterium]|nr:YebC/PmpR family DNA-binding transcriptional regulator [Saprospiraceae bacterium]MBK7523001.1 YebC/PmpR family DNA-binding transcriptional regulator [Saprospiraceae bacterium]MBK8081846.1 YebC/PmpR family DNA-binding transcriptional regulator [Saprospiraceae bacterium]MBK8370624.1 YebC/PmpR family DNA-binding transcriptional regulator [Saprospiraceae bacterium]MBK8546457.1 YebC/PmpR family DNA-binding transcriptional regulator [Saprospiraceae bacterium]
MGRAFEYRRAAKEKRWATMSRVFPKVSRMITMAAKEGGIDPDMNPKLRLAIQAAKAANMPKDNVENAIKRAAGKDSDNFVEVNYEGKGPFGVLVFVECATDNTTRTIANVKSYFNKIGGGLAPSGSLEFMFDRKTVVEFEKPEDFDIEEMELELIDHGLVSIELDDNTVYAYADYTDFGTLTKAIEEKGISITKANLQRIPTNPVEFTDEQMTDIEKLLDKLEDDDDVQAVYTNIA